MEDESGLVDPSSEAAAPTFSEWADELCAFYMSIGVPCAEYWRGDYTQLQHYVKAHHLRAERENELAWLQGAYIYDALCAVSPVLHAFAKRGTKPNPYHKEPYGFKGNEAAGAKAAKTDKEIREIQALNASAKFASFMTNWNKRFNESEGQNGIDDRPTTD